MSGGAEVVDRWVTRTARFAPDRRDDLRDWCLPYLDKVVTVTQPNGMTLTEDWWYLADQDWRADGPWLWFDAEDLIEP